MQKGILYKLNSTHSNLRTDFMEGIFEDIPRVEHRFKIIGKGINFGNRVIDTSPVQTIELKDNSKEIFFNTLNSKYKLVISGDTLDSSESKKYLKDNFKK